MNAETEFQLQSSGNDGVCITSLTFNGKKILFGTNNDLESFTIDGNNNYCGESGLTTTQLTIKNEQIQSSACD